MDIKKTENLITLYQKYAGGIVDYQKYTYYAITHHSTAIEGSTLSASQVINLLEYDKSVANKPFSEHQMVIDHFKAMQFSDEYLREKTTEKFILSIDFIKKLGEKVMYSTGGSVNTMLGTYNIAKGDFRLSSVYAGTRTFPDYKKVPDLLEKMCLKINEKLKTVITLEEKLDLAFELHFDFVSIHPFGDGNGRTARLLMNLIQLYFDLPLSIVFKQDRIKYINALEKTCKNDDIKHFLAFMYAQYAKFLTKEIKVLEKI